MLYVPVIASTGIPLMPAHPARARELVRKGKAVRRFQKGMFCIQLLERAEGVTQPTACGIDPGSKKEGFTVKSEKRTFLNIQANAVTWVKDAVEARRTMRRLRRYHKTPYRANRQNRAHGGLPPSTKARWQWKLRLCRWLSELYPIQMFVVEDIQARTKGKRRWDQSFSPLEVGKQWFYTELDQLASVTTKQGWETKQLREEHGLKKSRKKMAEVFEAHCVDSFVLAANAVGGFEPENKRLICITPLRWHRRQLHVREPAKGGKRKPYGSTRSLGFKRGSLVSHPKYGFVYVGGTMDDRISLHSLATGIRLCQNAKPSDCTFFTYLSWRIHIPPHI